MMKITCCSNPLLTKRYLVIILVVLLYSCSPTDSTTTPANNNQAGVVLSFDDDYVDEWAQVQTVLQPFDWKATFFVTRFNQLSTAKIQALKDLKAYGHEIAAHGLNHIKATTYISAQGETAYLNNEIYPMVSLMNANDLTTTSFAYPYGARNANTDALLLNEFEILRGTTYGNAPPAYQDCYYNNNPIVLGLGLDNSYPHFSIPYFLSLLEYAKNNNRIVIFYAHKPVQQSQADYETEYQTLVEICQYVQSHHMKFYKMSELYHLQNTL